MLSLGARLDLHKLVKGKDARLAALPPCDAKKLVLRFFVDTWRILGSTFLALVKDWWTWVVMTHLVRVRIRLFAAAMDTFLSHLVSLMTKEPGRGRERLRLRSGPEQACAVCVVTDKAPRYLDGNFRSVQMVVVLWSNVQIFERVPGHQGAASIQKILASAVTRKVWLCGVAMFSGNGGASAWIVGVAIRSLPAGLG